ncbi:MAG: hypothetical protein A2539_06080 [Elusimicrobia bacterium RIFOXYD2_FULL_34_15]|nr:MAG: hypothetical protein A2539_06080 [Elusimicrobia bacterium RIFOXYD2_FULL_34_15]
MKRNTLLYFKDILDNMKKAETFLKDVNYQDFAKDEEKNYAIVRCIEIIGEASKNIPKFIIEKYPDVPWRDIIRTRDLISHHYDIVDSREIWDIVKKDIPSIKLFIQKAYKDLKK